jgi:hypothetical protein
MSRCGCGATGADMGVMTSPVKYHLETGLSPRPRLCPERADAGAVSGQRAAEGVSKTV